MNEVSTDPVPLATAADLIARYPMLAEIYDPEIIAETMVEATDAIETMVNRRLAPFTNLEQDDMLIGIYSQEYGADSGTPLSFGGTLGLSFASALGGTDNLIRHFWLDQYAPVHSELWTYDIQSIEISLTYGNTQTINLETGLIGYPTIGKTDGHGWLQIGTFAPEGTRMHVVYSGGYTLGIPPALKRACIYQAAEFLIRDAEPQSRIAVSSEMLEGMIIKLLAPWARG